YFDSVGILHETSAAKTPQQNVFVERRNRTLVEAARTIVYNRRTRKIIETMNVTFDELSAMDFEQNSSRPGLQSMTSGQISSELELTYAPSTITPQRPSERDLDILFEPLHNETGRSSLSHSCYSCGTESLSSNCIYVSSRFCTGTNKFLKYSSLFTKC
nr:retrotransposon protein, putative, Ty1-copia subclass [Tanacetum cinerariifolium]